MWDAIAANQRRSLWLVSLMGVLLLALGMAIGAAINLSVGPWFGLAAAAVVFCVLYITAISVGDDILLSSANAMAVSKADAPQLFNIVEEMSIASGLAVAPRVFVIDDSSLNAFAVGYARNRAAVAVTAGLLKRLNRDELQGVIAHEIGHIKNQDTRFMTLSGVMLGAIVLMAHGFLRGMGAGLGRRSAGKGPAGAGIIIAIAVVLAILAPLFAQLLYFACSRRREYLADASSALFTRYPQGLAAALEKIEPNASPLGGPSKVLAPMYIVNPLQAEGDFSLFATHPPTPTRVRILRGMAGAGLAAYDAAYRAVFGERTRCIDARAAAEGQAVEVRAPSAEPAPADTDAAARAASVGTLLDKVLPLVIVNCPCGVRLKLTPDFKHDSATCPRCGRTLSVPTAQTGVAPADDPSAKSPSRVVYRRRHPGEWETFRCTCGGTVQLSPAFVSTRTECRTCHRSIEIESPESSAG